jgi:predicted AAA+ superfamily ATPase
MSGLVPRQALARLERLASGFRVVIVNGPRQAGKTTLVSLLQARAGGSLRSLDDPSLLAAARADPRAFVEYGETPRIIDEVQRGGDALVLAIKYAVDQNNAPGQFVLSGSTRFLTVPTLSESLAGRAAFVDVWPFSVAERAGVTDDIGARLTDAPQEVMSAGRSTWSREAYLDVACTGGFPEVAAMAHDDLRRAWFEGYLQTVIQRDVREFADVQHSASVPRLLSLVAARAGSPVVTADLARTVELNHTTVRNYLSYLDTVFLTIQVPAWSTNLTTKVARTPKTYIADSGLAAHLVGVDAAALRRPGSPVLGSLIETLVATELTKALSNQDRGISLNYFRDRDGREIDFVLEVRDGRLTAIEVKSSSTVDAADFRHLRWLRDRLGDRFTAGIVLHLGEHSTSFGDRLIAAPVAALWNQALVTLPSG